MRMILSVLVLVALGASQAAAQNLLKNPSFESPTVDTGSAVGQWFRFASGAPGGTSAESTVMPRTDARHMDLTLTAANNFAGVFQELESSTPGTALAVSPGQIVTFSGWHKSVGSPFAGTVELKLEWQGTPTNPPQNRFDVLALGTDYEQFTHTGVAPAGTDGVVITYAISSFGAGQSNVHVYVDDLSATVVPEPAAAGLLGLGALGLLSIRRRR